MALSVIVVDDEENILNDMERMLKQTVGVVLGGAFSMPLEALKFAHKYRVDVAILDINIPGLNGMELGEMLRSIHPDIQIIFATGYDEYAIRAYQMDAMAYLLKPCTFMDLQKSLDRVKTMVEGMRSVSAAENHCQIRCFGKFDVIVNGKSLFFSYQKAKELLAVLVDARGGMVSMEQSITYLWEDREYDERVKNLYRKALSRMRKTLADVGLGHICLSYRGQLALDTRYVTCDYFDFMEGHIGMKSNFMDNYMPEYSWAEDTNAMLSNCLDC